MLERCVLKKFFSLLTFLILFFVSAHSYNLVFVPSGGCRLGDRILQILSAQWFAYKYGGEVQILKNYIQPEGPNGTLIAWYLNQHAPFCVKPKNEIKFKGDLTQSNFKSELDKMNLNKHSETLVYQVPGRYPGIIDRKDPGYQKIINNFFGGLRKCSEVSKYSENTFNIAVHYRYGSGRDSKLTIKNYPNKFLGLNFYVEGIKEVIAALPDDIPLYIALFSDCKDLGFIKKFEEVKNDFPMKNIKIVYLSKLNDIWHDFFTISDADFIVRSHSSFSRAAEYVGNVVGVYYAKRRGSSEENPVGVLSFDQQKLEKKLEKIRQNKRNAKPK